MKGISNDELPSSHDRLRPQSLEAPISASLANYRRECGTFFRCRCLSAVSAQRAEADDALKIGPCGGITTTAASIRTSARDDAEAVGVPTTGRAFRRLPRRARWRVPSPIRIVERRIDLRGRRGPPPQGAANENPGGERKLLPFHRERPFRETTSLTHRARERSRPKSTNAAARSGG